MIISREIIAKHKVFVKHKEYGKGEVYKVDIDNDLHVDFNGVKRIFPDMKYLAIDDNPNEKYNSDIYHNNDEAKELTKNNFEGIFSKFMQQALENSKTGKAEGKKIKYTAQDLNNREILLQYGQGKASKAPHINWDIVDIYYIVEKAKLIVGIEYDKHRDKVNQMKSIKHIKIDTFDNNQTVAVFYETPIDKINFEELYCMFINVSKEIIRIDEQTAGS